MEINKFIKLHSNNLKKFIQKSVNCREDVEDILQDVFYQLAKVDDVLQPIEDVKAWLYGVSKHKIIDWHKKKRPDLLEDYNTYNQTNFDETVANIFLNNSSTPEDELLKELIWEQLDEALYELPEEQRWVFKQHELEGKSFKQLAEATGLTVNTLITRKHYAIVYLRKQLENFYNELINY